MSRFLHSDLGHRSRGDVLEVTLTRGANVRLLDSSNYHKYRRGEQHRYRGGLAKKSPARIMIPSDGHWHGVVDLQGLRGSTQAGFRVINRSALQPLPPIREPRADIAALVNNALEGVHVEDEREFDIFISHAAEDKDAVVRPLAHALASRGVGVWFDEFDSGLVTVCAEESIAASPAADSGSSFSPSRSSPRAGRSTNSMGS